MLLHEKDLLWSHRRAILIVTTTPWRTMRDLKAVLTDSDAVKINAALKAGVLEREHREGAVILSALGKALIAKANQRLVERDFTPLTPHDQARWLEMGGIGGMS